MAQSCLSAYEFGTRRNGVLVLCKATTLLLKCEKVLGDFLVHSSHLRLLHQGSHDKAPECLLPLRTMISDPDPRYQSNGRSLFSISFVNLLVGRVILAAITSLTTLHSCGLALDIPTYNSTTKQLNHINDKANHSFAQILVKQSFPSLIIDQNSSAYALDGVCQVLSSVECYDHNCLDQLVQLFFNPGIATSAPFSIMLKPPHSILSD